MTHSHRIGLTAGLAAVVATTIYGAAAFAGTTTATNDAPLAASHGGPKPTVVLVHGAFADASGWAGVITRLETLGYPVIAPANPLRSVADDSAYIASLLQQIDGPIILAGHSYGGEVITNAATGNPNVRALVYVAAFGPDQGETAGELATRYPGNQLTPDNLVLRAFPLPGGQTGTDVYINPAVFHRVFCADLPDRTAAVMAATQRPIAGGIFGEPSGAPAWRSIPSWYLVARQDLAIPPDAERFMARRMNAHTTEIDASHVAMISHPDVVTRMIVDAARTTG